MSAPVLASHRGPRAPGVASTAAPGVALATLTRRRRAAWSRAARAVSVALALLVVSISLSPGAALPATAAPLAAAPLAAAPADQAQAIPTGGDVGVRARSSYEAGYNPYGDDWAIKAGPNPAIPIGLTPACYRHGPKSARMAGPPQEETAFVAKSNSPIVWEECADVMDASGPDITGRVGDERIKANVAAQKAARPDLKYVGYLALVRADTHIADGTAAPVGLNYIHRNREDWFVHRAGTAPAPENRVAYIQEPGQLYDVTNPQFRAFMVARIVESLNYHGMDGFVLDQCFDLPTVKAGEQVPDAIRNGWAQGCLNLLAEIKAALDPLGKRVFFTGYRHIGSEGQGSAVNEAAAEAFYKARIDVSHGFYWEDAFRAPLPSVDNTNGYFSTERVLRLRDYAVSKGAHFVNIVNTFSEGQSSYPSSREVQQALARYYLAGFLTTMSTVSVPGWGPLTVMHAYTPIEYGPQFYSTTYFREWDAPIGAPLGAHTRPPDPLDPDGDPIPVPIYRREFQRGRVVFNASTVPYTVDLSDGQWTTTSGQAQPASVVVPPKTGTLFLLVGQRQEPCSPRPAVRVAVTNLDGARIRAAIEAGQGGGTIQSVRILETRNAVVDVQGGPRGVTGAFSHTPAAGSTTITLDVRRAGPGAMTVPLVVTDGCGEWRTFGGAGAGTP